MFRGCGLRSSVVCCVPPCLKSVDGNKLTRTFAINWDDPWLPIPYSFKVSSCRKASWPSAKVSDFINYASGQWRVQLLNSIFLPHEVEQILKIPLSRHWPHDDLVWHFTNDGAFSVKSAYHLAVTLRTREREAETSNLVQEQQFWKKLWSLKIPPRVSLFLWKASRDILPTSQNINRRLKHFNVRCIRCGQADENDQHILFDCPEAKSTWKMLNNKAAVIQKQCMNFKDWLDVIITKDNIYNAEVTSIIAWLLWKSRNEEIFEGTPRSAERICNYGIQFLHQFKMVQEKEKDSNSYQVSMSCGSHRKWNPPLEGFLKINVDASFSDMESGIGIVIRNHHGEIEAVVVEHVHHCWDPAHAEALAFLRALEFANDFDISHLVLEGDALCVVNKLNKAGPDLSFIGNVIEEIRTLTSSFADLKINYVNRKQNNTAHVAAKIALSVPTKCIWFSNFPMPVLSAACSDIV